MSNTDAGSNVANSGKPRPGTVLVELEATPLSGARKQALVYEAIPQGKKFTLVADEGPGLGGEESAPTPLSYITAGVGF